MKIILLALGLFVTSYSFISFKKTETESKKEIVAEQLPRKLTPDKQKSLEAFQKIITVLKSPRCINCHPTGDVPRQGDIQRLHPFGVTRGEADHGGKVQKCASCHHSENMEFANVPGAPHWGLAPKSMGWFGLSDLEIGKKLTDKKSNGGRTAQDLVTHMSSDSLVLWAWKPGKGRSKPPIELEEWKKVLIDWIENGAEVPTK
jgi:hypothetical protein